MSLLIYLADDDEDDRLLIRAALEAIAPQATIVDFHDGLHLLRMLNEDLRTATPLPDLLILDMNMPKLTGVDVLKRLAASPAFCRIPAVLLSTSARPEHLRLAYEHGAVACLQKPWDGEEYERIARALLAGLMVKPA